MVYQQLIIFKLSILQMDKLQDSFDGTFSDNIRAPAYKNQFTTKKHKMVINVSGILILIQTHNMQQLSMLPKRTNGTCKQTQSKTLLSIFVGLIIMLNQNCSLVCNPIKKSTIFQVFHIVIKEWQFSHVKIILEMLSCSSANVSQESMTSFP